MKWPQRTSSWAAADRELGLAHAGHALDSGNHHRVGHITIAGLRRGLYEPGELLPAPRERREIGRKLAEHPDRTAAFRQAVHSDARRTPTGRSGLVHAQRPDDRHHQIQIQAPPPGLEGIHERGG
ncbi:hypothetical protein [Streptomyces alanosinicus]|uniref:hypothetical protein n=1 Tax=Streptomyces alanosinicus TaxID=68171 RepID=UPI0016779296|nr:hypothetical protein [Streptomyces alanosinicus]